MALPLITNPIKNCPSYDNNQTVRRLIIGIDGYLYIDSKGNSCGHGHPIIHMHVATCGGEDAVSVPSTCPIMP